MGQKKLIRFAEVAKFPNVLQYPKNMRGNWNEHFGNNHPITLELACGKGEYTVGLAELYPERNFIGIDIKGNRIWVGAKKALQQNLNNVAFVRSLIDKITDYFAPGEVQEIWLTFPDPQLRTSKAKKRLTHPKFLRLYNSILMLGGKIHLKTDSPHLYNFTRLVISMHELNLLSDMDDVYSIDNRDQELNIKTHYEGLDIANSNRIHYLQFSIPKKELEQNDKILQELLKNTEPSKSF